MYVVNFLVISLCIGCWVIQSTSAASLDILKYNDRIYIQSFGTPFRWLSGGRGARRRALGKLLDRKRAQRAADARKAEGNVFSFIRNINDDAESRGEFRFMWFLQKVDDLTSTDCIRYGEEFFMKVYFHSVNQGELRLGCARAAGNLLCRTEGGRQTSANYIWKVRTNTGNGDFNDPDPAEGECVADFSTVFFQMKALQNRWLYANPGNGGGEARSLNMLGGNGAGRGDPSYKWILRRHPGSGDPATLTNALQCPAKEAKGQWVPFRNIGGDSLTVSYTVGVSRSESNEHTQSQHWEASVTATVEGGASFMGAGGSVSVAVTGSFGQDISKSVSKTLDRSTSTEMSETFDSGGTIWQWKVDIDDICGGQLELPMPETEKTRNAAEEPCCLPGYFQDNDDPHGPCLGDSPCTCGDFVCSGKEREERLRKETEARLEREKVKQEAARQFQLDQQEKQLEQQKQKEKEEAARQFQLNQQKRDEEANAGESGQEPGENESFGGFEGSDFSDGGEFDGGNYNEYDMQDYDYSNGGGNNGGIPNVIIYGGDSGSVVNVYINGEGGGSSCYSEEEIVQFAEEAVEDLFNDDGGVRRKLEQNPGSRACPGQNERIIHLAEAAIMEVLGVPPCYSEEEIVQYAEEAVEDLFKDEEGARRKLEQEQSNVSRACPGQNEMIIQLAESSIMEVLGSL